MARLIDRSFQPNEPVVARRFFVAAGRHYTPGDVFDWKRLAVDARRVRLLFEAGKLMHPEPTEAAEAETPAMPVIAPAPTVQQEIEDEEILIAALEADGLDDLNMKELREIAETEGAPFRVSREDQRVAIREHRLAAGG